MHKEFNDANIKFNYNNELMYAQTYNSDSKVIKLSIVHEDGICFPYVKCKDYLQEFFMVEHHLKKGSINKYGFKWKYSDIIKNDKVTFVFKPYNIDNINFENSIPYLKYLLYYYKRIFKFRHRLNFETKDNLLFITVSNEWFSKPALVSLFIVLVRYGVFSKYNTSSIKEIHKHINITDGDYGHRCNYNHKALSDIKSKKITLEKMPNWNDFKLTNLDKLHNYSGLISLLEKEKLIY